jgi:hypothetical protein
VVAVRFSVATENIPLAMMKGRKKSMGMLLIPRRFCGVNKGLTGWVPALAGT